MTLVMSGPRWIQFENRRSLNNRSIASQEPRHQPQPRDTDGEASNPGPPHEVASSSTQAPAFLFDDANSQHDTTTNPKTKPAPSNRKLARRELVSHRPDHSWMTQTLDRTTDLHSSARPVQFPLFAYAIDGSSDEDDSADTNDLHNTTLALTQPSLTTNVTTTGVV